MKILFLVVISLLLFSCNHRLYETEIVEPMIVIEKTYDAPKTYLPEGICLYLAQHPERGWYYEFQCDCNKYQNGDTVWYYYYGKINYLIY